MFIGRNGGKREPSQKVKKKKGEIYLLYSRYIWKVYLEQVRSVAEKKKSVVMDDEDGGGALSSPHAGEVRRILREDSFDVGNYNEWQFRRIYHSTTSFRSYSLAEVSLYFLMDGLEQLASLRDEF